MRAQKGEKHIHAKPGIKVIEIVAKDRSGTYRAVYSVEFEDAIYVLHAFKKKSKKGIATPKQEIDLIKQRLKEVKNLCKRITK